MSQGEARGVYYPALDGLRAVAVLIVLAAHAHLSFPRRGGVGVDIFFVLSGFLITTILSAEASRRGRISLRNFYMRRILRLAPCLVLTTALFCILQVAMGEPFPLQEMLIALTHTANWARAVFDVDLSGLNHYWSLAIEEQYYLVWPLAVILLERSVRSAAYKSLVLVALALLVEMYRAAMVGTFSAGRIYFALDTHMDGLIVGSALCYFVKALPSGFERTSASRMLGGMVVPMALAGLMLVMRFTTWESQWMGRYGLSLTAFAAAVLILELVTRPQALFGKLLGVTPLVYLGRISYGLYLLHYPIFQALDRQFPGTPSMVMLPLKIGLSVGAAALSYQFLETPFLKMKARFPHPPAARPAIEPGRLTRAVPTPP